MIKSPIGRRQTSWLFTSTVEQLNKGLARNKSIKWTEWDVNLDLHLPVLPLPGKVQAVGQLPLIILFDNTLPLNS